MKKTPINRVSDKQKIELALRSRIKRELIKEYGKHCMTCGSTGDWRGLSLSHIIPLGRGGKTTRVNCLLECLVCHTRFEKRPELRPIKS